jgi:hypothetical protein
MVPAVLVVQRLTRIRFPTPTTPPSQVPAQAGLSPLLPAAHCAPERTAVATSRGLGFSSEDV